MGFLDDIFKKKTSQEGNPDIPFEAELPRYNDLEEAMRDERGMDTRLIMFLLVVFGVGAYIELALLKPKQEFPTTKKEVVLIIKKKCMELSGLKESIEDKAENLWSYNRYCQRTDVVGQMKKYMYSEYKQSPVWITQNKELAESVCEDTCVSTRQFYFYRIRQNWIADNGNLSVARDCIDMNCAKSKFNELRRIVGGVGDFSEYWRAEDIKNLGLYPEETINLMEKEIARNIKE